MKMEEINPYELHKKYKFYTKDLMFSRLDPSVTESEFLQHVNNVGGVEVVSSEFYASKGVNTYGYLYYHTHQDAAAALERLASTEFKNKPLHIIFCPLDEDMSEGCVRVKNLDKSTDKKSLRDLFSMHGTVLSTTICTDKSGQCDGSAFVQYDCADSARTAISNLNGHLFVGRELKVAADRKKSLKDPPAVFNSICMEIVSDNTDEADLLDVFGKFGDIICVRIVPWFKDERFGIVTFREAAAAATAFPAVDDRTHGHRFVFTARELDMSKCGGSVEKSFDRFNELHIDNLDDSISDVNLKAIFSGYGVVYSCKVHRDDNGVSTGSGVVAFSTPEEAAKAIAAMNGKMIKKKKLCVYLAGDQSASSEVRLSSEVKRVNLDSHVDQLEQGREAEKAKLAGEIDVHQAANKAKEAEPIDAGHASSKEDNAKNMDVDK